MRSPRWARLCSPVELTLRRWPQLSRKPPMTSQRRLPDLGSTRQRSPGWQPHWVCLLGRSATSSRTPPPPLLLRPHPTRTLLLPLLPSRLCLRRRSPSTIRRPRARAGLVGRSPRRLTPRLRLLLLLLRRSSHRRAVSPTSGPVCPLRSSSTLLPRRWLRSCCRRYERAVSDDG